MDVSPGPFNKVATAFFSSQASSAIAERLFSDLELLQGQQRQSLLISSLEMNETIRKFVESYIKDSCDVQTALIHPHRVAFKRLCKEVAAKFASMQ